MHRLKKFLILVIFSVSSLLSVAQYYTSGADPANIKWNKIESENFNVIFPEQYTAKAQRVVKILEEVYLYAGKSLKHNPRKISVLIHSETAYSNGFVTWAPKRIELYNNPNQNIYAQDWLEQLALHEFRHVVQLDKLNDGFTKMLSYILGEQAVGAALGLFVPLWFLEGDAVAAETALTPSGRGRSPRFEQGMRAQIMDKKLYSYEKAMFGSYKDHVPNHYEMGYQLVAGARAKYGEDIWEQALYNTGRNPFLLTPFNQGQKKVSGLNKVVLYKETFADLNKKWELQNEKISQSVYHEIIKSSKNYVNYEYPVIMDDSTYVAEVSGLGEVRRFVAVNNDGRVKTLFVPGSRNKEPFSYANQTLCWSELEPDARWENRVYSVIKTYHLPTKKLKKVTRKSRYFSPALSCDGSQIATVSVGNQNNYSLVILDSNTGLVRKKYKHGDNNYLFTPAWNKAGTKLVCIALSSQGKEIAVFDLETEQWSQIKKPSFAEISLPKWGTRGEIIFTAGYSGTEEIYTVKNEELKQLTQSKYGARGADFVDDELVYSYYTSDGYQLVKANEREFLNISFNEVTDHSVKLHKKIAEQELIKPNFVSIDTVSDYEVKKYSKWNLFNFHSWAPAMLNVKDEEMGLGATAMSQNLLGTAVTSLGYNADSQKSLEKYFFNFKYQGWYSVLELDVKNGDQKIKYDPNILYKDSVAPSEIYYYTLGTDLKYQLTQFELRASLPINLTRGKYSSYLQPSVEYEVAKGSGYSIDQTYYSPRLTSYKQDSIVNIDIPKYNPQSVEYSLYFHRLLRQSARDVAPRLGQIAEVLYKKTQSSDKDYGSILGFYTKLYFPGVLKHHSFRIENDYQYKILGDVIATRSDVKQFQRLGNYFNFPRGYSTYQNDKMYSFKGDYIFPLCNPDLNLPGIFYLKRITTNLFYDYTKTKQKVEYKSGETFHVNHIYSSTGLELRGEVHAFRFMFPITVGYRYARLLELNQNKHEILMGINISGFSIGN